MVSSFGVQERLSRFSGCSVCGSSCCCISSSPEPLGSQGELIVYPCSSETAWPIKAKFHVEPPGEGGTQVCINGPGHKTKLATMPICGRNLLKFSSPEPEVL